MLATMARSKILAVQLTLASWYLCSNDQHCMKLNKYETSALYGLLNSGMNRKGLVEPLAMRQVSVYLIQINHSFVLFI